MDFVARGSSRQSMKLNLKSLMAESALKRLSADEKKYFRKKKDQLDEVLNSPLWYRFRGFDSRMLDRSRSREGTSLGSTPVTEVSIE